LDIRVHEATLGSLRKETGGCEGFVQLSITVSAAIRNDFFLCALNQFGQIIVEPNSESVSNLLGQIVVEPSSENISNLLRRQCCLCAIVLHSQPKFVDVSGLKCARKLGIG
jgi:hypothetical protein